MGGPPDHTDVARDIARELPTLAASLGSLLDEARRNLSAPEYDSLVYRIEGAHASVEAAAVEARRRVRLNEEQRR